MDFGFSDDPAVLVHASLDMSAERIYVKEMFRGAGMSTSQIASKSRKYAGQGLIICDSSDPRLWREIKSQGVNIQPVKHKNVKGAILSGINLLQDFDIVVDPKSTELIKEFNNYAWKEPGRPIDDFNHGIDALRYAISKLYRPKSSGVYNIR